MEFSATLHGTSLPLNPCAELLALGAISMWYYIYHLSFYPSIHSDFSELSRVAPITHLHYHQTTTTNRIEVALFYKYLKLY